MDTETVPVGGVIYVNGVAMRHVGGGHFETVKPEIEDMVKRFAPGECRPIGGSKPQ